MCKRVEEELAWEPGLTHATKIGVGVKDGVVTLSGFVNSYFEKWAAERAAKRVYGVKALAGNSRLSCRILSSGPTPK